MAKHLYETNLQVLEGQYREKLEAKDEQISIYRQHNASLERIVDTLASRPIDIKITQDIVGDRHQNISVRRINATGAGAFGLGDIYGTLANTINELPYSSNLDELGIKELLDKLKRAIDELDLFI